MVSYLQDQLLLAFLISPYCALQAVSCVHEGQLILNMPTVVLSSPHCALQAVSCVDEGQLILNKPTVVLSNFCRYIFLQDGQEFLFISP
jgi:hypothetical protein